ncbi:alpha/beta hydrolase [Sedimenticola selenatireducens]|uniref:Alpha/beta hydrolase n=1 Tax=Sedimenticola selenatireducens TaxID=191960 RepID=A0A557SBY1_9GAMM|nr:alpha/beta hydrolase [Sedimenticola selenatireducens]TVO74912.1 alpha/beta hydrolase [Sedimenticola selenatireducens]TVT62448.1 MAG: alpha/beta hydrolase [Sedimenticola selenatireducens]
MKLFGTLILSAVGLYLLACAWLYFMQHRLIYYPTLPIPHAYLTVPFESDGETINLIVINPGKTRAILYFGGNAEAVLLNAEPFKRAFPDHTVYLVNYRGYGGSSGKPSERELYADALRIYDDSIKQHSKLVVVGRSLGSGIATYLASERPVEKLVLITPYDSIVALAQRNFPWFPAKYLMKEQYDSLSRVSRIDAQTLIIVADHDRIVPEVHTRTLADAFPENQVKVAMIKSTDHNSISLAPGYYSLLQQFMLH